MLGLYAAFNLNAVVAVVGLVNVLIVLVTKAYPCLLQIKRFAWPKNS